MTGQRKKKNHDGGVGEKQTKAHEVIHLGLAREDGTKHGERPAFLSPWSNLADLVDSAIGSERARECVNLIIRSLFWKIIWRILFLTHTSYYLKG